MKYLESSSVTVVVNDTDILVALIALADNNNSLCVLQPANVKTPLKVFIIQQLQTTLVNVKDVILFLHAATGSDTTCAIFGKGKKLAYKVLKSNPELCRKVKLFYQPLAARDDIASVGEEFLLALYNSKRCNNLNELRYFMYSKRVGSKQKRKSALDLSNLPPTSDAARQHFFRVYLQVQDWLGNEMVATEWGSSTI